MPSLPFLEGNLAEPSFLSGTSRYSRLEVGRSSCPTWSTTNDNCSSNVFNIIDPEDTVLQNPLYLQPTLLAPIFPLWYMTSTTSSASKYAGILSFQTALYTASNCQKADKTQRPGLIMTCKLSAGHRLELCCNFRTSCASYDCYSKDSLCFPGQKWREVVCVNNCGWERVKHWSELEFLRS